MWSHVALFAHCLLIVVSSLDETIRLISRKQMHTADLMSTRLSRSIHPRNERTGIPRAAAVLLLLESLMP